MPDCSQQQAAYDLALATEAVRLAEWAVEAAEASLAWMAYHVARQDRATKQMELQQCQMGMGMLSSVYTGLEKLHRIQRSHVELLKSNLADLLRQVDLLRAMQSDSKAGSTK